MVESTLNWPLLIVRGYLVMCFLSSQRLTKLLNLQCFLLDFFWAIAYAICDECYRKDM